MAGFTDDEARLVSPFFSNMDKDVFVLTNLPEVVKGALFSRYSRSDKSLRRLLLDEFINDRSTGFSEIAGMAGDSHERRLVATRKAEEFYDRVLVGYGDDSVAELGGAHIACEGVSSIAAKALEDSRLGISPLEKSTRYVYFDRKAGGEYLYHREKAVMGSRHADLYVEACDSLFDSYAKWLEPMRKFLVERFPRGDETERAYSSSIKAKACDVLRGYLPAATLTNVGLFGNGRAFEYLLTKMFSSGLGEVRGLAGSMEGELMKVIPSFVKRARGRYGDPAIRFMSETRSGMRALADGLFSAERPRTAGEVTLVSYDGDAEEKVVAAAVYPFTGLTLAQVRERVRGMGAEERAGVISEYVGRRENRRHRPGRGFEHACYEFDVLMNFASYRDLQRHRVMTQQRQGLTTEHGYDLPPELEGIGASGDFAEKMALAAEAYRAIRKGFPEEAQYVVPFAYRVRYACCLNLRELYHLVELRSTIQGHPDYRRVVLRMLGEVRKVHPSLVEHMRFVDYREAGLERLEAEKRTDRKMEEAGRMHGV